MSIAWAMLIERKQELHKILRVRYEERKSYPVVEEFFIEWKLYEDLHQSVVPCIVRHKVCWG